MPELNLRVLTFFNKLILIQENLFKLGSILNGTFLMDLIIKVMLMVGIWQITADGIQLIAIKGEFQN